MFSSRVSILLILSTVVVAVLLPGCSDDKSTNVYLQPTIDNIWPNEDGTFWEYGVVVNTWDIGHSAGTMFDCDDDPPPLPTWEEIEALLEREIVPDPKATIYAEYRIAFAGDTTSLSGATGQNLRESVVLQGAMTSQASRRRRISPLIARLYLARPDLRSTIGARLKLDPGESLEQVEALHGALLDACFGPECPLLIHGYVWEKTDEWIGTYGDVDTLLAWKFLEADLSPGHEFTHQLVPSLADNVFLHCKVLGGTRVSTGYQRFMNGLDCLYIVDYGVWTETGPGGEELGCSRMIDYGRVIYVPEVGPVFSHERALVFLGEPLGPGYGERFLSLRDTGLPPEE